MPLVDIRDLVKVFWRRRGLAGAVPVRAVDGVSLAIDEGETFGLVGESGSGKTTIARCVLRLVEPTSGEIRFRGEDLLRLRGRALRRVRRDLQMIFQDPYSSLDPRMRAGAIVEEPLVVHRTGPRAARRARVRELFELVGLEPALLDRYPHELSGGQRQRVAIARALALRPAFLVADEPVSALDVSVQAQIVNLLLDLQARLGLTYLLIAHDVRLVRHVCRRAAVLYRGRIVETARTIDLFDAPMHPYTRALLAAVPSLDPDSRRSTARIEPPAFDPAAPLREVAPGHYAAV